MEIGPFAFTAPVTYFCLQVHLLGLDSSDEEEEEM